MSALAIVGAACSGGDNDASGPSSSSTPVSSVPVDASTSSAAPRPESDSLQRSGGDGTTFSDSSDAFAQGIVTLTREERRAFAVGNSFFNENWVTAPSSTEGRDGLGPLMNAQSCSSCHFKDGRGEPPADAGEPTLGLLLRLSVMGPDGQPIPVEGYGGQLQDRSIGGVPPEGTIVITNTEMPGVFADGTPYSLLVPTYSISDAAYGPIPEDVMISPRVAPAVFGVGLLEAIPAETILAAADPDDADGDGISGAPNMVPNQGGELVLGRFGWKANVATVEQQNAGAFLGDVGITSSLDPEQNCTSVQTECLAAPGGGNPELDDDKLQRVTFYTRTLAVPARRDVDEPNNVEGEQLFAQIGCSSCHTPEFVTGPSDIAALADQTIRPYTDLLVHDMGPALADDRPDFAASGAEWRTAPLWGIGLVDTVNRHTRFLHDGRARDLSEAILWHAGEAAVAQQSFTELTAVQRAALISFLESL